MQPRKAKVAAEETGDGTIGIWSKLDRAALRKLIDPIGKAPRVEPFGMFGSEARGLISAPKAEVYERSSAFLSTVNVTSALVLSSIAGMVTSPFDISALPEDRRPLGIAANFLTYPMVAIQVCIVMFSTYVLLMLAAHAHSPDVIYRALAHLGNLIGSFQFGIYLPLLIWLVQIVLIAHINLGTSVERWTCTALVAVIYLIFHMEFSYSTARAFPRGMWGWLFATAPWLIFQKRVRSDLGRMDGMYSAGMEEAVMQGIDRTKALHEMAGEGGEVTCSPEEQKVTEWLLRTLPELSSESIQRSLLIRAMVNQGLHLPTLIKTAKIPGGFRILVDVFSFSLEEDGLELSRGDRLRLATAVMEDAVKAEPNATTSGDDDPVTGLLQSL